MAQTNNPNPTIDSILKKLERDCLWAYNSDDPSKNRKDSRREAKQALEQYIAREVLEGRIDELDHIDAGAQYHYDADNSEDVFDRQEKLEATLQSKKGVE